jgi:hypothetical protein
MTETETPRLPSAIKTIVMRVMRLQHKYPETRVGRLPQKDRQLRTRRAKNKVARASRKTNRP